MGSAAHTKPGGLGLLRPASTALSKDHMITAHGMKAATRPWPWALPFVFPARWLCGSIMLPGRFVLTFGAQAGVIPPGSQSPISLPTSTIIGDELGEHSWKRTGFMPFLRFRTQWPCPMAHCEMCAMGGLRRKHAGAEPKGSSWKSSGRGFDGRVEGSRLGW